MKPWHVHTMVKRHLEDGSAGLIQIRGRWGYDENCPRVHGYFEIPMEVCVLSHTR
jgi:hypothetical protein